MKNAISKMKNLLFYIGMFLTMQLLFNSCSGERNNDPYEKLVGTWEVSEQYTLPGWGTLEDSYTINITKSPSADNIILIENFGNIDETVTAIVKGNSITIASQSVDWDGDLITVTGSDSIRGSKLTYCYNIPDYWNATCTATKL